MPVFASRSFQRSAKELVRYSLSRCGLGWVQVLVRRASGQNLEHLRPTDLSERFRAVYRNGAWLSSEGNGPLSGLGSSLAATEAIRAQLPGVFAALGTQTLLDVGCGDFTWMKEVALPCTYVGVDIVPEVIATNRDKYCCEGRTFRLMDATSCVLPAADTVLCREVLFHLSFPDIWSIISAIKHTGARFFLATNDEGLRFNADILSGDYRLLNLRRAPFFFPKPAFAIPDNVVNVDRVIAVWEVSQLPS